MAKPITFCVVGAGDRGRAYAAYMADYPQMARLVAVAEPRDYYRNDMAMKHHISADHIFETWRQLAAQDDKLADAVVIATPDGMHTVPALAFIKKGYHILLEKPMAPTKDECIQIAQALVAKQLIFAVCHVLRYTPYTQTLKQLLDSGVIGDVISVQHLEPIGYDHFAHSFVRGHWRKEKDSSFMLLSKCCHDLDWIQYIIESRITKVSSFGNLKYFKSTSKPDGATQRCVDCPVELKCPYSAIKIYLDRVKTGDVKWPVDTITSDLSIEGVQKAIHTGPYGRCVYGCDNDVVDHQVVNMQFQNGASGAFTVTAFTENTDRRTRLFGTHGELYGDGKTINIYDFLKKTHTTISVPVPDDQIKSGHSGGDYGLMKRFVEAVAQKDQRLVLSGTVESVESYMSVFAAEEARLQSRVVNIRTIYGDN